MITPARRGDAGHYFAICFIVADAAIVATDSAAVAEKRWNASSAADARDFSAAHLSA